MLAKNLNLTVMTVNNPLQHGLCSDHNCYNFWNWFSCCIYISI